MGGARAARDTPDDVFSSQFPQASREQKKKKMVGQRQLAGKLARNASDVWQLALPYTLPRSPKSKLPTGWCENAAGQTSENAAGRMRSPKVWPPVDYGRAGLGGLQKNEGEVTV